MPLKQLTTHPIVDLIQQLDGRSGNNRAKGNQSQIAAQTDVQAIAAWLARYEHSPRTFANYRKEAERLLLWALIEREKPLSSLRHEDMLAYQQFLVDPQPAERWRTQDGTRPPRHSPLWRPFAGPLSDSSQQQSMLIINALFSWLVQAGYLAGNPLALAARRIKLQPRTERYLSPQAWQALQDYVANLPQETPGQKNYKSRSRWILSILYGCGLRVSELVHAQMSDVYKRADGLGRDTWWLRVKGKGGKVRQVPLSTELMAELQAYRLAHGLGALPHALENRPLFMPLGGGTKALTRAAVHALIKHIAKGTLNDLAEKHIENETYVQQIAQMSAHWIRHTAGSHMANQNIDIRIIRDILGHESISTSNRYLHTDEDQRHEALENKHKLNWRARP